jgi:hypothetical protein
MLQSSTHPCADRCGRARTCTEARTRLRLGEGGYRRDHVRAFAQSVEVADDAIYIKGSKGTLLRTLVASKRREVGGNRRSRSCSEVADGVGFEPTRGVNPWRFSRPLPSTARPPVHRGRHHSADRRRIVKARGGSHGGADRRRALPELRGREAPVLSRLDDLGKRSDIDDPQAGKGD